MFMKNYFSRKAFDLFVLKSFLSARRSVIGPLKLFTKRVKNVLTLSFDCQIKSHAYRREIKILPAHKISFWSHLWTCVPIMCDKSTSREHWRTLKGITVWPLSTGLDYNLHLSKGYVIQIDWCCSPDVLWHFPLQNKRVHLIFFQCDKLYDWELFAIKFRLILTVVLKLSRLHNNNKIEIFLFLIQ